MSTYILNLFLCGRVGDQKTPVLFCDFQKYPLIHGIIYLLHLWITKNNIYMKLH